MASVRGEDEREVSELKEVAPKDGADTESLLSGSVDDDKKDETVIMAAGDSVPCGESELKRKKDEDNLVVEVGDGMKTVTIESPDDTIYENGFSDYESEPIVTEKKRTNVNRRESGDVRRQVRTSISGTTRFKGSATNRPVNTQSMNTTPRRYRRVWRASASARARSQSSTFTNSRLSSSQQRSHELKHKRRSDQKDDAKSPPREGGDNAPAKVETSGDEFGTNGKPIIYTGPTGTITVILRHNVILETTVDRAIRLYCHDKFSSLLNGAGTTACVLHPKAKIYYTGEKVYANFSGSPHPQWKSAAFGPEGVLFTMSHLNEVYLVSSSVVLGTTSMPLGHLQFPSLNYDYTLSTFYNESQTGEDYIGVCNEIAKKARHGEFDDGSLSITVNGLYIKQEANGDVQVNMRPRHISCSPSKGTIRVRTDMVDMSVQEKDKAYVKFGMKHVHVSRSGMVASDGKFVTSMDHTGRIVSST